MPERFDPGSPPKPEPDECCPQCGTPHPLIAELRADSTSEFGRGVRYALDNQGAQEQGERVEGWATKYRESDPISFKPGDDRPNSKAGMVRRAILYFPEPAGGDDG